MIVFSTHHRCGTVLIRNMLRHIVSKKESCTYEKINSESELAELKDSTNENTCIYQNTHGHKSVAINSSMLHDIHLFRHPYDLLISHISYHIKTDSDLEACNRLMVNGITYQEHLKGLDSLDKKAEFEIQGIYGRTLSRMLDYDYSSQKSLHLHLDQFNAQNAQNTAKLIYNHLGEDFLSVDNILEGIINSNRIFQKISHGTAGPSKVNEKSAKEMFSGYIIELLEEKYPDINLFEKYCLSRQELLN